MSYFDLIYIMRSTPAVSHSSIDVAEVVSQLAQHPTWRFLLVKPEAYSGAEPCAAVFDNEVNEIVHLPTRYSPFYIAQSLKRNHHRRLNFSSLTPTQPRHTTIPLFPLRLERNLHPELLRIRIPPSPVLILPPINLPRLQLERARLVGLSSNK